MPGILELNPLVVQNTVEPTKYGPDSNGKYYTDQNMVRLCGPGAAANALYYWNGELGTYPKQAYLDTSISPHLSTTWDDTDNRSYIMYIAWDIAPPGWAPGMMDNTQYPSLGVTEYSMSEGLNWVASGDDPYAYQNYFYTIQWWNGSGVSEAV